MHQLTPYSKRSRWAGESLVLLAHKQIEGSLDSEFTPRAVSPRPERWAALAVCAALVWIAGPARAQIQYWDGSNTVANGQVDGGSGTWGGSSNWTNASGTVNDFWMDDTAIFAGAPGTVETVEPMAVQRMRFDVNGYVINGILDNTLTDLELETVSGVSATIGAIIGGSSGIIKTGEGTLFLTGANSFLGDIFLNGGMLHVQQESNLGDPSFGGGRLVFDGGMLGTGSTLTTSRTIVLNGGGGGFAPDAGTTLTINSVITGNGGLTLDGAGTVVLGAANTYSGGTTIAQGVVQTMNENALGTGGLDLDSGTLILGGNLNVGPLSGAGGAISLAGGNLAVNQSTDGVFAGDLSGPGQLIKNGSANLTLSGDNSYTGGTTINGGVLIGDADSLHGLIVNNAMLEFAQAGDGEFDGTISGTGGLVKSGSGVLTFNGDQTFTGDTSVTGGGLIINGEFASANLTLSANTFLGGSGVIAGNLDSAGMVGPGNSPGTLRIGGNLRLRSSSVLVVELASRSNFDRLIVGGRARLDGTLLVLNLGGFVPATGDSFTILTADRVTGAFDDFVQPASLQLSIVYGPRSVVLETAGRVPYPVFAKTHNQFNAAVALETLRTRDLGSGSDFDANIRPILDLLPAPALRGAFEAVAPSQSIGFSEVVFARSRVWLPQMAARLADIRAQGAARSFPNNERGPADAKEILMPVRERRWGAWADGSGVFNQTASFENLGTGDGQSAEGTVGADYRMNENLSMGLYAGYIGSWTDFGNGSEIDSNGSRFGIYSTYHSGGFYLNNVIGGEWNSYDWKRRIVFPGIDRTADADTDGTVFETMFGGGYDWKFGSLKAGLFSSLEYTLLLVDGFTEDGAGSLNLRIDDQDADSLRTNIGGQLIYEVSLGSFVVRPSARVAWRHEYLDASRLVDSALAAGAGPGFSIRLPATGRRDSVLINTGLNIDVTENLSFYAYYTGDISGQTGDIHAVNAGLRYEF